MNLIEVMERFPDQETCITFLEQVHWKGKPECPHCYIHPDTHKTRHKAHLS